MLRPQFQTVWIIESLWRIWSLVLSFCFLALFDINKVDKIIETPVPNAYLQSGCIMGNV